MNVPTLCCLVFGMGMPLVENEAEETLSLAVKERSPADGWRRARDLCHCADALHDGTAARIRGFSPMKEESEAADWIERNAQGYGEGVVVVERDARWTQVGESVFPIGQRLYGRLPSPEGRVTCGISFAPFGHAPGIGFKWFKLSLGQPD